MADGQRIHNRPCVIGRIISYLILIIRQKGVRITSLNFSEKKPMDIMQTIKEQVEGNPILIYMKGSPDAPQCGFSSQATQALMACGEKFAYIDILSNPEIRANLPQYSEWPTFPQLFVAGELVGGCDIIMEMHQSGELLPIIKAAAPAEQP